MRFGIVGCGVIGAAHAEAIASLADAQLAAVVDVPSQAERARKLAERFGARAYIDLQEMLDREQLDVVNICTPSGLHGEPACLAMRSGRHVIVEKPMEITLEAIDAMLRVQEEAGVKLAVISQRRFDAAARRVYDLIQEGAIGRLVLGTAHIPLWRSQAYYDSAGWRGTWAFDGGGVLMNQGIHSIDLLQWLMGPVRRVTAYTDTLVHQIETEDVAVAALRFASGALGAITATTGAYPGLATRIDVLGDKGSAIIERERLRHLHLARDDSQEVGPYGLQLEESAEEDGPQAQEGTHAMQIADMIRAIREDGTPLVDGHAARKPVQIILAVYESARTGQEVQLS